jgi:DNA-binding NarL/FixJ family response regulator
MNISILIIDDHQLFNDGLALILKEVKGFQIVGQVYDSREAIYQYKLHRPDLVLVDFNMPHLDGSQVVKQIKKLPHKCKIVVISMFADSKEILLFKELGVHGYLSKTTPAQELHESLLEIMEGKFVFKSLKTENDPLVTESFAHKYRLSKREIEILKALKAGKNTEEIADSLNLSYFTVATHRKNINQKLNFENKQEFYDFLKDFNP